MSITKINNIFTKEELDILDMQLDYSSIPLDDENNYVDHKTNGEGMGIHDELGRLQFGHLINLPISIVNKVSDIAKNLSDQKLSMSHAIGVEYNAAYGSPNLPVHYDHDTNDLIINFQLSSNTKWDIGIDLKVYELEDNSALVFNGNEYTHWRPRKIFNQGEFIKMIFFRFCYIENRSDYSNLDYAINHDVFKEVNEFRDSLS